MKNNIRFKFQYFSNGPIVLHIIVQILCFLFYNFFTKFRPENPFVSAIDTLIFSICYTLV